MKKKQEERVIIFDTTLRDGEQSPGCSMNTAEKLRIAKNLEKMGVDVIEAGFPIASIGDFEAVNLVARETKNCEIAGLCRANNQDIDRAWEALSPAEERGRIHTFIATSEIHLKYKLKMSESEVIKAAFNAVKRASLYTGNIEFSCEDAVRTRLPFLAQVVSMVIDAGAKVVNIPDTVGYTTPEEYFKIISYLKEFVPNIDKAIISVHCHNDLGLAVANSLSAVRAGARQVECTVNGIGERAGNCSLEEFVMTLKTRADILPYTTGIITEQIVPTSKLLSSITGMQVQANKAVVGANAFAHEAGIHQHGVLCERSTYEIMTPESVGLNKNSLVLGKHSGRHAFIDRLKELGHDLSREEMEKAFAKFKNLCDQKKVIFDEDLDAIVFDEAKAEDCFKQIDFIANCSSFGRPSASIIIQTNDIQPLCGECTGDGPVDAVFSSIKEATKTNFVLKTFSMDAVTEGSDAQATCVVRLEAYGREFLGRGTDTNVITAAAKAYVSSLNKIKNWEKRQKEKNGNGSNEELIKKTA